MPKIDSEGTTPTYRGPVWNPQIHGMDFQRPKSTTRAQLASQKPKMDFKGPKLTLRDPKSTLKDPKIVSQMPRIDSQRPKIESQNAKSNLDGPTLTS